MTKLLTVIAISLGVLQTPPSAKRMFYDPGDTQTQLAVTKAVASNGDRLRSIAYIRPFPPHGHVGIHFWFEDENGTRLSEGRAASAPGRVTLHVRTNVGGFLSVWFSGKEGSMQFTPQKGPYADFVLADDEQFVAPGIEYTTGDGPSRLMLVLARSQTEQVNSFATAVDKLQTISKWTGPNGPKLIRETDDSTRGEIGTYVVNQDGGPAAAEVVLRRR